jgi:hypothetical protein
MKKFLPIFLAILFFSVALISPVAVTYAQQQIIAPSPVPTGGLWVVDPEVTFIGKNAARSGYTLNWTLQNYQWSCVTKVADRNCDNTGNPLQKFWLTIVTYIVAPMLILVILVTSAVIIITRGKSLTIMRFLPRFVAVLLLIVLSYSILQYLYQFFDMIQGFFLRSGTNSCPPDCISNKDLLYVGWNYQDFIGLRLLGDYNAESAFTSLLLTKLTALTYFVMVGVLLIRKIILWFFIIVSPVFPILLLYYPIRNTGKIWIGEFFRWLLYGPLFAIFLSGLVFMWRQAIPLQFGNANINNPSKIIYPTAVNILLGGPRQFVTPTNSVNLTETFMLYVVALIMLWIVILLPWILLQIFLDYAANFAGGDSAVIKNLVNLVSNKMVPPASPAGYPPQSGGAALNLPFTKRSVNIPVSPFPGGAAKEIIRESQGAGVARPFSVPQAQVNAEVMSFASIPLPTMRDIAKYETALLSNNESQKQDVVRMQQTLEKIANPVAVTSTIERERYSTMKDRLMQESQQGNIIATSILSAVNTAGNNQSRKSIQATSTQLKNVLQQIANPALSTNVVNRERMSKLHDMLSHESKENNNQLATSILSVTDRTTATELDKIKDQLVKEQALGNPVASTVTSTVKATQIKSILQQIASPASIINATEREKFSKLHDMLARESKEKNNELATSILQVKDSTSVSELEKISEKLEQSKESTASSQVLATINNSLQQSQSTSRVKTVLQQVANPATATAVDKQKINKLHEALKQESEKGNELATSILGVNEKTTTSDIEKLQEKLRMAKEKGQPLAADILTAASQESTTTLPTTNRIQTVTQEELEEVKKMWKENYGNMEVPEGMAGNRTEWIKDDVEKISTIVSELMSGNTEKINQGLQEVSNILPFLLVGGFSQSDIVSYLIAKQEAAKGVLQSISAEEETKVTVETKHTQAAQTMTAQVEVPNTDIGSVPAESFETTNIIQPQVSNEILAMVNLKVPTMKDIVRFETISLARDKSKDTEVQKTHELLENIADPTKIHAPVDREKMEKLRERLIEESQKGNNTADMVLAAASVFTQKIGELNATLTEIKTVLQQIALPNLSTETDQDFYTRLHEYLVKEGKENNNQLATKILSISEATNTTDIEILKSQLLKEQKENQAASQVINAINRHVELKQTKNIFSQIADPTTISSPVNKERFAKLHDQLIESSKTGNPLASAILDVKPATKTKDIDKLTKDLSDAKQKNDSLAKSILSTMNSSAVPSDNRVQTVTKEDYEEIKKMWEENYRTLPVPLGFNDNKEGRIEWIQKDSEEIQATIDLLQSPDTEKKNEGLKKVGTILPFLLLGGFSYQEIVAYLNVKLEAAKTVLIELKQGAEKEEKVDVVIKTQYEPKAMAAEEEITNNSTGSESQSPDKNEKITEDEKKTS